MNLGQFVRTNRERLNLTQDDLAAQARVSRKTITRLENNTVTPKISTVVSVLSALNR